MTDRRRLTRWQIAGRATRSAQNLLLALAGAASILWTPNTIQGELGPWLTWTWAVLLALGGSVAAFGVATDKLRIEWPACWFVAAGIAIYASTAWAITLAGAPTRSTQALVLTAVCVAWVSRATDLGHRAAVARMAHDARRG